MKNRIIKIIFQRLPIEMFYCVAKVKNLSFRKLLIFPLTGFLKRNGWVYVFTPDLFCPPPPSPLPSSHREG